MKSMDKIRAIVAGIVERHKDHWHQLTLEQALFEAANLGWTQGRIDMIDESLKPYEPLKLPEYGEDLPELPTEPRHPKPIPDDEDRIVT